jgi:hypothetical protein
MSSDQFRNSVDLVSTMYGTPHSDFTFIFAGAPFFENIGEKTLNSGSSLGDSIFPIGGAVQFSLQESRNANQVKVIGNPDYIPLPGQGTPKSGIIQGLLLFSDMDDYQANTDLGSGTWHLLKKMYSYMLYQYPDLVEFFYEKPLSGINKGKNIGIKPVSYGNSDKWRNFGASSLYDLPIGLYAISKTSSGNTLQASYLEGVRLQGRQDFTMSSVNNTPMYETVTFVASNEVMVDPEAVLNLTGNNPSDFASFTTLIKNYLKGQ